MDLLREKSLGGARGAQRDPTACRTSAVELALLLQDKQISQSEWRGAGGSHGGHEQASAMAHSEVMTALGNLADEIRVLRAEVGELRERENARDNAEDGEATQRAATSPPRRPKETSPRQRPSGREASPPRAPRQRAAASDPANTGDGASDREGEREEGDATGAHGVNDSLSISI